MGAVLPMCRYSSWLLAPERDYATPLAKPFRLEHWYEIDLEAGTLTHILEQSWVTLDGPRPYYPSRFAGLPLRAFIDTCHQRSIPAKLCAQTSSLTTS